MMGRAGQRNLINGEYSSFIDKRDKASDKEAFERGMDDQTAYGTNRKDSSRDMTWDTQNFRRLKFNYGAHKMEDMDKLGRKFIDFIEKQDGGALMQTVVDYESGNQTGRKESPLKELIPYFEEEVLGYDCTPEMVDAITKAYNQWWFYAEEQLMPYDEEEEMVNESINRKINRIIKESMRRVLKEGTTIDELEEQLNGIFEENLLEIYRDKVEADGYYDFDVVEDYCSDYANMTAEQLSRDCITVINSSNWDVPKNNFRPFGYVMETKYGITNKEQLLSRDDAAEIIISWFWGCFGTNSLAYNFSNDLNEYMDHLGDEDED